MKRFKFSLQALFNYKKTVEKTQKAELQIAQQRLRELLAEERRLEDAYDRNERSLEKALRENLDLATALSEHDAYFRYLRDALKELRVRIAAAEEYKDECQARLLGTMKEIKTYTKLREEQFAAYRKELQAEDDKEMGDIVSFNVISE